MRILSNIEQSKTKYVATAYLIALSTSLLVAVSIYWLFEPGKPKDMSESHFLIEFIGTVIIAPSVETLLMIPIFGLIGRITKNIGLSTLLSALIWAGLHSLIWPIWGLVVFWSFLVFSYAFLQWKRESIRSACIVVFSIHALVNLTAFGIGEMSKVFEDQENQIPESSRVDTVTFGRIAQNPTNH